MKFSFIGCHWQPSHKDFIRHEVHVEVHHIAIALGLWNSLLDIYQLTVQKMLKADHLIGYLGIFEGHKAKAAASVWFKEAYSSRGQT